MMYQITITQLRKRNTPEFRTKYKVTVTGNGKDDYNFTFTKWGARRVAKKMIAAWDSPYPKVIEEYEL